MAGAVAGMQDALFFLPTVALVVYASAVFLPVLAVMRLAKI